MEFLTMWICGSDRLFKQCGKRLCALTGLFVLLLGIAPVVYADATNLNRNWQHDAEFWNSLSLRIQDVRAISARSKRMKSLQEAQRSTEKSTVKNIDLLVVHRTEKLTRTGGKTRRVTVAKAMLNIDGERRVLEQGQSSPEGVTLVSAGSDHAVVEINGQREMLNLDVAAVFPGSANSGGTQEYGDEMVSLWEGPGGFFYADGAIDDYPVNFLLDTGANTVVISSGLARRIGIDFEGKEKDIARTVGGTLRMVRVTLERVSVGNITLHDVAAGIFEGPATASALLGMSFLGQVDLVQAGDQMELRKR
jgi:aspartyl protease family protein